MGEVHRDGLITSSDEALDLPRLAPWSWQGGVTYDIPLEEGLISMRTSWNHRDVGYWSDANTDTLPSADIIDASVAYTTADGKWTATLYGKNLTDDSVPKLAFTIVPGLSVNERLNKGRVLGVELQYQY